MIDIEASTFEEIESMTEIQTFFKGTSIFVTGATGFLGHVLLAKLLRSCRDINRIYILLREKRGMTAADRFKEMLEDEVFRILNTECPESIKKVTPMVGDCLQPNLGLSESDIKLLKEEVNIIFHVAATVRFDAPLKDAVNMNVRSTSDLLDIANETKNLKAFVHVSTAFSNCVDREVIEEKLYDPPISAESLFLITEKLDENTIDRITPGILGNYPNTYVYTKAVAEDVCKNKGANLPLTIFRPAIVISTAKEPIPGWINNVYGPTGCAAAAAVGLLKTLHTDQNCTANVVPCDYVVNAAIAAAWNVGTMSCINRTGSNNKNDACDNTRTIPIYNYSIDLLRRPFKWKEFIESNEQHEPAFPSSVSIMPYSLTLNKYKFIHQLYCVFLHLIPALIIDSFAKITGKEQRMMDAYQKVNKLADVLAYFSTREWIMTNNNVTSLWSKLSDKDKEIFYFNLCDLNIKEYFYIHVVGIRKFILKEDPETIPAAQARRRRMVAIHYSLLILIMGFSLFIIYNFFRKYIF